MEYLNDKTKQMNTLNKWVNKAAPLLIAEAKKGYQVKANGELFVKDKSRFDVILDTKPFRAYLDYSAYSGLILVCDITYKTSEFSCGYYKHNIYLEISPFEALPTNYTAKKIQAAKNKLIKLREQISKLESQRSIIKSEFDLI